METENNKHVLLVEDEHDMARLIERKLNSETYTVKICHTGDKALSLLEAQTFDGIILDLMLPGLDGWEVLKQTRSNGCGTPVIILTAIGDKDSIIRGLDNGANDYIVKPFDLDVLAARLRALLRKPTETSSVIYSCGNLIMDTRTHTVNRGGKVITLTQKEYDLLRYLMENQNVVITKEQLQQSVWKWNDDEGITTNVVAVYIRYLRKKIDEGFDVELIHTMRGVGYRLAYEEE